MQTTGSKLTLEGRNISMDRLYTSMSIAKWLRDQSITVIGTLMTNRTDIPDEIKVVHHRNILAQLFTLKKRIKT